MKGVMQMERQKPALYEIREGTDKLPKEFIRALTEGLLLTLQEVLT